MSSSPIQLTSYPQRIEGLHVEQAAGAQAVLRHLPELMRLAERSGQTGEWDDLAYVLEQQRTHFVNAVPLLVLMHSLQHADAQPESLIGALLCYQHRGPYGIPTRVYSTGRATPRRTLLAPVPLRPDLAVSAARYLMQCGAEMVYLSFACRPAESVLEIDWNLHKAFHKTAGERRDPLKWAVQHMAAPLYLPLHETFAETLARMGQKTRANLRYYKRRAVRDLNCTYLPSVELSLSELQSLNLASRDPKTSEMVNGLYEAHQLIKSPLMAGVQDGTGRLISVIGGRRGFEEVEIHWQMNHAVLPRASVSTVARSFLIEDEVNRGTKRLLIEGGTSHSLYNSFVRVPTVELVLRRPSLYMAALTRLLPSESNLSLVLNNRELRWFSVK